MTQKPNILFIMTDQQHAGMMRCAGNERLSTPAMDSLARDGIRLERAYCTNPICVPSRISMATGMMPCRLGADTNPSGMHLANLPPAVDDNSMGRLMKRAGYDTFYGGKVHMCRPLQPENAGYDEHFIDERDALPAACISFIQRKRTVPFFAVASFVNPHDICFAHRAKNGINTQNVLALYEEACALPEDSLPPLPLNYGIPEHEPTAVKASLNPQAITPAITMRDDYSDRDWRINRWIYHRLTEKVDHQIGKLLEGLRQAGCEEHTLVIFTSDHGNMDASHRLTSKGIFYEESVGIPLIMKYPAEISAGQVDCEHLVSTGLDILPTLCDYAERQKPAHMLGRSLRPLTTGASVSLWRDYVVAENEWFRMLRTDRFKYCAFADQHSAEWLGDLANDHREMRNLAAAPDFQKVLAEHRGLLADWSKLSNDRDGSRYCKT
ncbi:MAG: sulfatase-like hydrolase/transferase [Lentisphaerae bacterium]|nr:sulfatase-like hydrolase/transferase [Lentisphaerota bacterium]